MDRRLGGRFSAPANAALLMGLAAFAKAFVHRQQSTGRKSRHLLDVGALQISDLRDQCVLGAEALFGLLSALPKGQQLLVAHAQQALLKRSVVLAFRAVEQGKQLADESLLGFELTLDGLEWGRHNSRSH